MNPITAHSPSPYKIIYFYLSFTIKNIYKKFRLHLYAKGLYESRRIV